MPSVCIYLYPMLPHPEDLSRCYHHRTVHVFFADLNAACLTSLITHHSVQLWTTSLTQLVQLLAAECKRMVPAYLLRANATIASNKYCYNGCMCIPRLYVCIYRTATSCSACQAARDDNPLLYDRRCLHMHSEHASTQCRCTNDTSDVLACNSNISCR